MTPSNHLLSAPELDPTTVIGDEYLEQVRMYGVLGYSPQRISTLLGLSGKKKTALTIRISLQGDTYHEAYHGSLALGEYNIDAELAKKAETGDVAAIEALEARKQEREIKSLRQQLFGV